MAAGKRRRTRRRGRWRRRLLGAVLLAPVLWALWVGGTWPDIDAVVSGPIHTSAFIERQPGARQTWLPYARIDDDVKIAVLAAEDTRFFQHEGFDTHELKEALKDAAFGDGLRGASTITQQVAKNLWLRPDRSFVRKLQEALLAAQLERAASKHRILEIYLNIAEFGPGVFGVEAASQRFYGHSAARLSEEEAAELAAGLPRTTWYPGVKSKGYREAVARIKRRAGKMRTWMAKLI